MMAIEGSLKEKDRASCVDIFLVQMRIWICQISLGGSALLEKLNNKRLQYCINQIVELSSVKFVGSEAFARGPSGSASVVIQQKSMKYPIQLNIDFDIAHFLELMGTLFGSNNCKS